MLCVPQLHWILHLITKKGLKLGCPLMIHSKCLQIHKARRVQFFERGQMDPSLLMENKNPFGEEKAVVDDVVQRFFSSTFFVFCFFLPTQQSFLFREKKRIKQTVKKLYSKWGCAVKPLNVVLTPRI